MSKAGRTSEGATNSVAAATEYNDWDAPAQRVLCRLQEARSQRAANQVIDELSTVVHRIKNIYSSFELKQSLLDYTTSCSNSIQYVNDMRELHEMLGDQLKKKRYQDRVTVYIVGYENTCNERIKLLQQIAEFFAVNSKSLVGDDQSAVRSGEENDDEDEIEEEEKQAECVTETLDNARQLTRKLSDLHQQIIESVQQSNTSKTAQRQKKKLEASLQKAQNDISSLSKMLINLQNEMTQKEELLKQLTAKLDKTTKQEKLAAETLQHAVASSTSIAAAAAAATTTTTRTTLDAITTGQVAAEQSHVTSGDNHVIDQDNDSSSPQTLGVHSATSKRSENLLSDDELLYNTASRPNSHDVTQRHTNTVGTLPGVQETESLVLREVERKTKMTQSHDVKQQSNKQTATNHSKSLPAATTISNTKPAATTTKQPLAKINDTPTTTELAGGSLFERTTSLGVADNMDHTSTDAHGGNSINYLQTSPSTDSEPTVDNADILDSGFELNDEESWASVPTNQLQARFKQFRTLALQRLLEVEEQLNSAENRTLKKVNALKSQFNDQKIKWQAERQLFQDRVGQTQRLQVEADNILVQLEIVMRDHELFDLDELKAKSQNEPRSMSPANSIEISDAKNSNNGRGNLQQTADSDNMPMSRDSSDVQINNSQISLKQLNPSEEKLVLSASSRAALYVKHRGILAELKSQAEQTRASTVGLLVLGSRQASVLSAELDEDMEPTTGIDNMDAAKNKEHLSLQQQLMSDEEIVAGYLTIYRSAVALQQSLQNVVHQPELVSEPNIDDVTYQSDEPARTQTERLSSTIQFILEESNQLLNQLCKERERTQPTSITDADIDDVNNEKMSSVHLTAMIHRYQALEKAYEQEKQQSDEHLNHQSSVIDELQTTVDTLKRELFKLQSSTNNIQHIQQTKSPIMFTRLDSERNAKTMRKAVIENRLDSHKYKSTVHAMNEYNRLPAQRFRHLVQKYICHTNMADIEENVQRTQQRNPQVWDTVSKMEALHSSRMQKLTEVMHSLTSSRLQLADHLMDTLADIEQESGIFLIKPMFSFRRYNPDVVYHTKRTRPNQPKSQRKTCTPMPQSPPSGANRQLIQMNSADVMYTSGMPREDSSLDDGVVGQIKPVVHEYSRPMWTQAESAVSLRSNELPDKQLSNSTPRLLELDVSRQLIGQNHISVNGSVSRDATTTTRSYFILNRNTVAGPSSSNIVRHSLPERAGGSLPCTPPITAAVFEDKVPNYSLPVTPFSRNLSTASPLPPINNSTTVHEDDESRETLADSVPSSPSAAAVPLSYNFSNDDELLE